MIGGNWCFESGDKIETTFAGVKTKNHTVSINISNTGLIKQWTHYLTVKRYLSTRNIQINDDPLPQYRNPSIDPAETRSIRIISDVVTRLYSIDFLKL
ncbi:hypothetical protein DPMN_154526 [Dreissena polymorpha]|uniref:Uncharacterized protein n=1 Tax=Dreissena polymorpha TaxID=45954 RepID=A0A9D4FAE3_DREPO|nr:hypothetical protein DPMN_148205 [Dreissena polymorpha]KAH3800883.1 hypothetical protein DPMN_154526 [Dreissena polymorpha]